MAKLETTGVFDPLFFTVDDMVEIDKTEYYEARKDARKLPFGVLTWGFLYSVGHRRIAYITYNGKFYKGELRSDQNSNLMATFEFKGVYVQAPQAVFRRKLTPNEAAAQKTKAA